MIVSRVTGGAASVCADGFGTSAGFAVSAGFGGGGGAVCTFSAGFCPAWDESLDSLASNSVILDSRSFLVLVLVLVFVDLRLVANIVVT
jgi:hypothetical protein